MDEEQRKTLIARLAENDYQTNWQDKSFVIEYLENEVYGKLTDEELQEAAESVSLDEEE